MTAIRSKLKLFFDRALSESLWRQIVILIAILLGSLLLSFLLLAFSGCDWIQYCVDNDLSPWLLPIYLLIDSNALNCLYLNSGGNNVHGWMLFACSLTYMIGLLLFNGMIIGVITNLIEHRVEKHRNGLLHYLKSGHYIIMGYDDMVPSIIEEIFSKDREADILLLTAADAEFVRKKLLKSVARDRMEHIFITYGQRTVTDCYEDICLERAKEIYVVGKRDLPSHDAVNIECVDNICAYLKKKNFPQYTDREDAGNPQKANSEEESMRNPMRITCVFEDFDTYAAFKTTEIFQKKVGKLKLEFIPYNFYSHWAKQVFIRRSYKEKMNRLQEIPYPSVYGPGVGPDGDKYVHLVFVGTSTFAVAFAEEAAHYLHFPAFNKDNTKRTRITFIEQNAEEELRLFATRTRHFFDVQPYYYVDATASLSQAPSLKKTDLLSNTLDEHDFLDVEFEFIKGDAYSKNIQDLFRSWSVDEGQYLSIFFAMADQRKNFVLGMNMPDEVYDHAIPVFIRQNRADDFVTNLRMADSGENIQYWHVENGKCVSTDRKGRYAHIYPFGMEDMAYFDDEQSLKRAKLINYLYGTSENNHFTELQLLNSMSARELWQNAEKYWKGLKVAERWSNLYSAQSISCKLDILRWMRGLQDGDVSLDQTTLSAEEEDALAVVEHNRWNVEKLLMGYRKAKPDEDKYLHPDYPEGFKNNKKKLYIHHDIRPFKDLDDVREYDYEIVKYIPWILKMTES